MSNNKENKQKKIKKQYPAHGQAHICATFQNTIITITDVKGDTLCSSSVGQHGYSNSRKKQAFGAGLAAEAAAKKAESRVKKAAKKVEQKVKDAEEKAEEKMESIKESVEENVEKTTSTFKSFFSREKPAEDDGDACDAHEDCAAESCEGGE